MYNKTAPDIISSHPTYLTVLATAPNDICCAFSADVNVNNKYLEIASVHVCAQ